MIRKKSFDGTPTLYLVATPIGNLEDITYRAIHILNDVDKIYAEDTRNSLVLLNHYQIKTHLESYHEFNQEIKTKDIINELLSGMNIAIITDAGLPVISDPGFKIAREARNQGIAVTTIPGASAGISALVSSGLPPKPYTFYGFLDSKSSIRINELNNLKFLKSTLIFYEAPHRIVESLTDMKEVLGNRNAVIARELTKKHEEYICGTLDELINASNLKGEMVVLVEGYLEEGTTILNPNEKIDELISLGYKPNEAIKEVAKMMNKSRNDIYKAYALYKRGSNEEN